MAAPSSRAASAWAGSAPTRAPQKTATDWIGKDMEELRMAAMLTREGGSVALAKWGVWRAMVATIFKRCEVGMRVSLMALALGAAPLVGTGAAALSGALGKWGVWRAMVATIFKRCEVGMRVSLMALALGAATVVGTAAYAQG